ncbi:hypothetical protein C8R44DRAFT_744223 [Mycena epipterygia]|nr:hypothetical protein C8R44DRAFT_744223 [Mycena epipterygia]
MSLRKKEKRKLDESESATAYCAGRHCFESIRASDVHCALADRNGGAASTARCKEQRLTGLEQAHKAVLVLRCAPGTQNEVSGDKGKLGQNETVYQTRVKFRTKIMDIAKKRIDHAVNLAWVANEQIHNTQLVLRAAVSANRRQELRCSEGATGLLQFSKSTPVFLFAANIHRGISKAQGDEYAVDGEQASAEDLREEYEEIESVQLEYENPVTEAEKDNRLRLMEKLEKCKLVSFGSDGGLTPCCADPEHGYDRGYAASGGQGQEGHPECRGLPGAGAAVACRQYREEIFRRIRLCIFPLLVFPSADSLFKFREMQKPQLFTAQRQPDGLKYFQGTFARNDPLHEESHLGGSRSVLHHRRNQSEYTQALLFWSANSVHAASHSVLWILRKINLRRRMEDIVTTQLDPRLCEPEIQGDDYTKFGSSSVGRQQSASASLSSRRPRPATFLGFCKTHGSQLYLLTYPAYGGRGYLFPHRRSGQAAATGSTSLLLSCANCVPLPFACAGAIYDALPLLLLAFKVCGPLQARSVGLHSPLASTVLRVNGIDASIDTSLYLFSMLTVVADFYNVLICTRKKEIGQMKQQAEQASTSTKGTRTKAEIPHSPPVLDKKPSYVELSTPLPTQDRIGGNEVYASSGINNVGSATQQLQALDILAHRRSCSPQASGGGGAAQGGRAAARRAQCQRGVSGAMSPLPRRTRWKWGVRVHHVLNAAAEVLKGLKKWYPSAAAFAADTGIPLESIPVTFESHDTCSPLRGCGWPTFFKSTFITVLRKIDQTIRQIPHSRPPRSFTDGGLFYSTPKFEPVHLQDVSQPISNCFQFKMMLEMGPEGFGAVAQQNASLGCSVIEGQRDNSTKHRG